MKICKLCIKICKFKHTHTYIKWEKFDLWGFIFIPLFYEDYIHILTLLLINYARIHVHIKWTVLGHGYAL